MAPVFCRKAVPPDRPACGTAYLLGAIVTSRVSAS